MPHPGAHQSGAATRATSVDRKLAPWAPQERTFAGVTVLRFNDVGKVVDHRDYDNHVERREAAGST